MLRYPALLLFLSVLATPAAVSQEKAATASHGTDEYLCEKGFMEEGIRACSRLLLKSGYNNEQRSQFYWNRGNKFFFTQEYRKANQDYTRTIELNRNNIGVLEHRCEARGYGNFELAEGLDDCNETIRQGMEYPNVLFLRALILVRLNKLESAIADLDKILKLDRRNAAASALRGIVLRRQGNTTAAAMDLIYGGSHVWNLERHGIK